MSSFDVGRGEVLGSSAATAPARARCSRSCRGSPSRREGEAEIRGRVGSLLEVGTGFHPELTGRENIYLNGAILGMKRHRDRPQGSTRSSSSPRSSSSSTRRSSATRAGCTCGWPSPWRRTWSRRSCWWTRCWRSAMPSSRSKCLGKMGDVAAAGAHGAVRQPQHVGHPAPDAGDDGPRTAPRAARARRRRQSTTT